MFAEVLTEAIVLIGFLIVGVVLFVIGMRVVHCLSSKPKVTPLTSHIINATYGKGSGWSTPLPKNDEKKPS